MCMRRKYIGIWIRCNYFYIIILFFAVIDVLLFLSLKFDINGKVTYHSIINWGIDNNTVFAAIMMGLATVSATIYTNNKNLKVLKFSVMPNTFQLKTNLEYELLFYQRFVKNDDADELITFVKIFSLFINNRSNFSLIAPKTYKDIIFKVLMYKTMEMDRGLSPSKEGAVKIIRTLGKLMLIDEKTKLVPINNIEFFDKYWDGVNLIEGYELKITKRNVGLFLENIKDDEIRKETLILYDDVLMLLRSVLNQLDSELKILNS